MSFGPIGLDGNRLATGGDACLEQQLAFFLGRVSSEPVSRARQLPRRFEVTPIGLQPCGPDISCAFGARDVVAVSVERVGLCRLRGAGTYGKIE